MEVFMTSDEFFMSQWHWKVLVGCFVLLSLIFIFYPRWSDFSTRLSSVVVLCFICVIVFAFLQANSNLKWVIEVEELAQRSESIRVEADFISPDKRSVGVWIEDEYLNVRVSSVKKTEAEAYVTLVDFREHGQGIKNVILYTNTEE